MTPRQRKGPRAAEPAKKKPKAAGKRPASSAGAFLEFLGGVREEVDRRLAARWDAKLAELARHGKEVQAMAGAARDLTLRGGKRFRAGLLMAAYTGVAPRASRAIALEAGVALELLQSYLLVQDDWMDHDATRRGGPSVHAALSASLGDGHLGAASAMLASDLLWGLALATLASVPAPADRRIAAIELLCRVHEDVVIGQQIDLIGRAEDVEAMHALKTGSYTVRGPLLLGATLAGADERAKAALERYAAPVGVAFQLRDDLLGMFGSSAQTGKPEGSDLRAGKRTAVVAEGERLLTGEGRRKLVAALGRADASDEVVRAAADALEACGARAAVEARLSALCSEAEGRAARLPLDPKAKTLLKGAARALRVERKEASAPVPVSVSVSVPVPVSVSAPVSVSVPVPVSAAVTDQPASALPAAGPFPVGRGRAFGKIILLGEHTVVYGAPALAAGIERGARASARRLPPGEPSFLHLAGRRIPADAASSDDLAKAFAALLAEGTQAPPVAVEASSDLPPGGGLGSSAALAVAIARALDAVTGASGEEAKLLARAGAWERVFHGNPSGIDTATAFHGAVLRFSRAGGVRLLKFPVDLWLCIGWSGESSSTRSMVEGVARMHARRPDIVERSISGAAALVDNATLALEAGDLAALGKLMDLAQMVLAGLMVSTEAIERMCSIARGAGALGAKLTGAGGGGSVIALVPSSPGGEGPSDTASAVLEAWRTAGYNGFVTRAGGGFDAPSAPPDRAPET
jgi:geranylgeranyl diphosphate synthase type I